MKFVDLHIHSSFSSDGEWSPERIVSEAVDAGAGAISISDHDTVDAVAIAREAAAGRGVELVPSVEISVEYEDKDYHLLAPLVNTGDPELRRVLAAQSPGRIERARLRIEKLKALGFDIDYDSVAQQAKTREPVGTAIARAIFEMNRPSNAALLEKFRNDAGREIAFYREYFEQGHPAYVPLAEAPMIETIALVRRSGGVPTLAHPGAPFIRAKFDLVAELAQQGLQGLEVYSSYHDAAQVAMYEQWARDLNLAATAGSDFHGRMKPHVAFGSMRKRAMDLMDELRQRREHA